MKVSLLDQGVSFPAIGPYRSVKETLFLARRAEELGFERVWIAEHHESSNTCGAPEVLIAAIAQHTKIIRLGSGASLLPYYNPLRLATAFRLLEYLAPARIDLSIGRGQGAQTDIAERLGYARGDYREQIIMLRQELEYLTKDGYPEHEIAQLWLTGSSVDSATLAGDLSLPFCFAQFTNSDLRPEVVKTYRSRLSAGTTGYFGLGLHAICAESQADLEALRRMIGKFLPRLAGSGSGGATIFGWSILVGSPAQMRDALRNLVDLYQPDELFVTATCPDFQLKLRSFELIAELAAAL